MTPQELLREKVFSKFHKDTWEIKTIGEIATDIYIGSEVRREDLGTGDHPAIKCGDINSQLPLYFEKCISFLDPSLVKKPKYFEHGDLLISKLSNKSSTVGTVRAYLGKEKCLLGDAVYALKHKQNPKFLAYVLSTENARKQIKDLLQESTVFHIYPKDIKQIKIPLPSLEIQQEIVEFLDRFTELERELKIEWEKESEKRKLQYEYYRDNEFKKGIKDLNWPIKTIEEIAQEIISGSDVRKDQMNSGSFPAIRYKDIHDSKIFLNNCINFVDPKIIRGVKYVEPNYLLIAKVSENVKDSGKACAYLGKEKAIIGGGTFAIKHELNPLFLSFAFSCSYVKEQIKNLSKDGIVVNFPKSSLIKVEIPVPPLGIQEMIVEKLYLLHKIINDIREGIPFLIRKNREQYEFYRELLLEPIQHI